MGKSVISFNVPPKLWEAFRSQTDRLFLSRAPFLDYMLARELPELRAELAGLRLSTAAKRYVAGRMKRTGPTSVNIEVRPETADALRDAVRDHNIVRDAFVSRLIMFLRSSPPLLKLLEIPSSVSGRGRGAWLADMPTSPLEAMEVIRDDPLYYVRHHCQENWGCGIYRVQLQRSIDWSVCYLDDDEVPNSPALKRAAKLLEGVDEELAQGLPAGSLRSGKRGRR